MVTNSIPSPHFHVCVGEFKEALNRENIQYSVQKEREETGLLHHKTPYHLYSVARQFGASQQMILWIDICLDLQGSSAMGR